MYKPNKPTATTICVNKHYEGESIEAKIRRVVNNKEPISDGAPLIYTDRKDGVRPEYDIRTDRFEIAVEAMDKVAQSHVAKRTPVVKLEPREKGDGGAEPIPATPPSN